MSSTAAPDVPVPASKGEARSFYEVNLYALGRVMARLHLANRSAEMAAALQGRTATAIVDKVVIDALYGLIPVGPDTAGFVQRCDPMTEPDCPEMLFG